MNKLLDNVDDGNQTYAYIWGTVISVSFMIEILCHHHGAYNSARFNGKLKITII